MKHLGKLRENSKQTKQIHENQETPALQSNNKLVQTLIASKRRAHVNAHTRAALGVRIVLIALQEETHGGFLASTNASMLAYFHNRITSVRVHVRHRATTVRAKVVRTLMPERTTGYLLVCCCSCSCSCESMEILNWKLENRNCILHTACDVLCLRCALPHAGIANITYYILYCNVLESAAHQPAVLMRTKEQEAEACELCRR